MLVTPICPHTLTCRPMLLPGHQRLRLQIPLQARSTGWASFDGRHRIELRRGDEIVVTASRYPVPTICRVDGSRDWFRCLRQVLQWNERRKQKGLTENGKKHTKGKQRREENARKGISKL